MPGKPSAVTRELEHTQRWAEDNTKRSIPDWMRTGVLLKDVLLTYEPVRVPHKLGRVPEGWVVINRSSYVNLREDGLDENIISLRLAHEQAQWKLDVPKAAGAPVDEQPIFTAHNAHQITSVNVILAPPGITANAVNFRTFRVQKRPAAAPASAVTVAVRDTRVPVTDDITAWTRWDVPLVVPPADLLMEEFDLLTIEVEVNGAMILPEALIAMHYQGTPPVTADIWVF